MMNTRPYLTASTDDQLAQEIADLKRRMRQLEAQEQPASTTLVRTTQLSAIVDAWLFLYPPNVPLALTCNTIASSLGTNVSTATATPWFFVAGRYTWGNGLMRVVEGNNANSTTRLELAYGDWWGILGEVPTGTIVPAGQQATVGAMFTLCGYTTPSIWGTPSIPKVERWPVVYTTGNYAAVYGRYRNIAGGVLSAGGNPTHNIYELCLYRGLTL